MDSLLSSSFSSGGLFQLLLLLTEARDRTFLFPRSASFDSGGQKGGGR
jgi:hypothetical protein